MWTFMGFVLWQYTGARQLGQAFLHHNKAKLKNLKGSLHRNKTKLENFEFRFAPQ